MNNPLIYVDPSGHVPFDPGEDAKDIPVDDGDDPVILKSELSLTTVIPSMILSGTYYLTTKVPTLTINTLRTLSFVGKAAAWNIVAGIALHATPVGETPEQVEEALRNSTDQSTPGPPEDPEENNNYKKKSRSTKKRYQKKQGKLGEFKGRDALRQENNMVKKAAKKVGLNKSQQRQLHDSLYGQEKQKFSDILKRANQIKNGQY